MLALAPVLSFDCAHVFVCAAVWKSIVRTAIRAAKDNGRDEDQQPKETAEMLEARMEAYQDRLVSGMAKSNGKVEVAHVDMEQELKDRQGSMFELFPTTQWPPAASVRFC